MTPLALSLWPLVNLSLFVACLGSFVWAIRRFFVRQGAYAWQARFVTLLGAATACANIAALWFAATARRAGPLDAIATPLLLAALSLFWWSYRVNRARPLAAIGTPTTPEHLTTNGPYAHIRHPFYTAYLLAWIGGVFGAGMAWFLVPLAINAALYRAAAISEEAMFAGSKFSDDYKAYARKTGRFFPRIGRRG